MGRSERSQAIAGPLAAPHPCGTGTGAVFG